MKLFPQALSQRKSPSSSSDTHFIPGKRQELLLSWTTPLLFQAAGNEQVFAPMALIPCDGLDITWSTSQRWFCLPILNCSWPTSRCYGNAGCTAISLSTQLPVIQRRSCPMSPWIGMARVYVVLGALTSSWSYSGSIQAISSSGFSFKDWRNKLPHSIPVGLLSWWPLIW